MLVTPGEAWGQAILWQAASKRLNVKKMHMPLFTFGLFEAAFHVPRRPPGFAWGYSHFAPSGLVGTSLFRLIFRLCRRFREVLLEERADIRSRFRQMFEKCIVVDVRIPFDGTADFFRKQFGAFRRDDIVVLGVDHGAFSVAREHFQTIHAVDGIVFGDFPVELLLLLFVFTREECEKVFCLVRVGGEHLLQIAAAENHEGALDAMVDGGGIGGHERAERKSHGAKLLRIDFGEGEQDVVGADGVRPCLFKSLEERFFRSDDDDWAEQAAALAEIGQLDVNACNAFFSKHLADFALQLEFVRSDCMEDLHGGRLVIRFGVQRKIDFAENGVVDGIVRRCEGGREADGEAAEFLLIRKRRDFNIERRAKGWLRDGACLGHEDG